MIVVVVVVLVLIVGLYWKFSAPPGAGGTRVSGEAARMKEEGKAPARREARKAAARGEVAPGGETEDTGK